MTPCPCHQLGRNCVYNHLQKCQSINSKRYYTWPNKPEIYVFSFFTDFYANLWPTKLPLHSVYWTNLLHSSNRKSSRLSTAHILYIAVFIGFVYTTSSILRWLGTKVHHRHTHITCDVKTRSLVATRISSNLPDYKSTRTIPIPPPVWLPFVLMPQWPDISFCTSFEAFTSKSHLRIPY